MSHQQNQTPPPQPANDNNNKIRELEAKITALEEYCLNVDYSKIPPPSELQYLFVKTQGTGDFFDPETNDTYPYEGELVRDEPYGFGTVTYPNGTTYKGEFLVGKKHGEGVLEGPTADSSDPLQAAASAANMSSHYQTTLRYLYGNRDGLFETVYSDGRKFSDMYLYDQLTHCSRKELKDGRYGYSDALDGKRQGLDWIVDRNLKTVTLQTYENNKPKAVEQYVLKK